MREWGWVIVGIVGNLIITGSQIVSIGLIVWFVHENPDWGQPAIVGILALLVLIVATDADHRRRERRRD